MKKNKSRHILINIFSSGKINYKTDDKNEGFSEQRMSDYMIRYILMNFIHIFGSVVLILFIFQNLAKGSYFDAVACSFMAFIGITGFIVSRTRAAQIIPAYISMITFGLFCIMLIWNGDAHGAGFLFIYIYPLLTVILLGMAKGIMVSLILLIILSVEVFVPNISKFVYHLDVSLRMIAAYVLVLAITLVFETSRKTKDKLNDKLTTELKNINENLQNIVEERTNNIMKLRDTFGRYLPDTIIKKILDSPSGPSLGGEKRIVTILFSDIREFTSISEKYESEVVVKMLNYYFSTMIDIIHSFNGTIIEFIGDSILAIFGAPLDYELHADNAVACALKMQLAMSEVNQWNISNNYPSIEMGIGINSGEAIVGNIGSKKTMKYNIIGKNVNLASRIEGFASGRQIFISNYTLESLRAVPTIINTQDVYPKGFSEKVTINQVVALGKPFNIAFEEKVFSFIDIQEPVSIALYKIQNKNIDQERIEAKIFRISKTKAIFSLCDNNFELNIFDEVKLEFGNEELISKIIEINNNLITAHFKSDSHMFISAIKGT